MKKRSRIPLRIKVRLIFFAGISLLAAGILMYLNSPPSLMQGEVFSVREGDSFHSVSRRLKKQNLIRNQKFFRVISLPARKWGVKKGKYRIEKNLSSLGIMMKMVRGKVITHKITIPEGFNLYSIAERLEAHGITPAGEFIYYASNKPFISGLDTAAPSLEGYLFPDTYLLPEESDSRDVLTLMNRRMKTIVSGLDLSRMRALGLSLHELLTLASLIEKEAKIPSERVYISAAFHNRLKRGMKLDCDPTVRYAVKNFKGSITRADLANPSPFNTYIHRGLPPTPICSPGAASIKAALNPARVDFIYFVSRNDGSHYFSNNLREHGRAVEFYQKGIKNGFVDRQKL